MKYLYKLIDTQSLEDLKKGLIRLTRPIFSFMGSEGYFIDFTKRIKERYLKKGLNIYPTQKDLNEINKWLEAFTETRPGYTDCDIISEARIMLCVMFQTFCGYFTKEKLENEKVLSLFLKNNDGLKNKIGFVKVPVKSIEHSHWKSLSSGYIFEKYNGGFNDLDGRNGFLKLYDVTYCKRYKEYLRIFKLFNERNIRSTKHWFTILPDKFRYQKEKRIVFSLRSIAGNSSVIGFPRVYRLKKEDANLSEIIFQITIDAVHYCRDYSDFLYLKIDPEDILITDINKT